VEELYSRGQDLGSSVILRRKQGVEEIVEKRVELQKSYLPLLPHNFAVKVHMHEIFDFADFLPWQAYFGQDREFLEFCIF
jgi:hypothetical protein